MYQALYRKYRPRTFTELCGQDHVSRTLKSQVESSTASHAYLFCGSRGTGKTSSAKILAKALNCLNPQNGDPCNECEICKGIDNGSVMDVFEIDAASNRGIDDIRDIRDKVAYAPAQAKFKVYIIDEVHMLTDQAFNALLKTIEEPPAHAVFILATTESHKIPATILSRCQRYDFSRIASETIAKRIIEVCSKESIECDPDAAMLIAKLADGGMRDALSMLDMCVGTGERITETTVSECAGITGRTHLFNIVDGIEKKDISSLLTLLDELYDNSCDMERLCNELVSHYRDLMMAKTAKSPALLITATKEDLENIVNQAKNISFESIMYAVDKFYDCIENMKSGANKRTSVEVALIKLCTPSLDTSLASLTARIGTIEDKINSGNISVSSDSAASSVRSEVNNAADEVTDNQSKTTAESRNIREDTKAADLPETEVTRFEKWPEIVEKIRNDSPLMYAYLTDSSAYFDGKRVLIKASEQFMESMRRNPQFGDLIKNTIASVCGVRYGIGPYKGKVIDKKETKKSDKLDDFIEKFSNDIEVE